MASAPETVCQSQLVWLTQGPVERALVGGKGACLSQLAMLGAPVPPAFALTTHAYADFAASLALPRRASEVADRDLPALRERITTAPLPASICNAITAGYVALGERHGDHHQLALAVRSSATAEDAADFSFAGQHDTILDVRTLPSLEAAVKQCWASLWSERAVAYRRDSDRDTDEAAIAVVVQQLIQSDVSFVAFTRDPLANGIDEGHLVISATWGLGEAIVSGLVVPDHIEVNQQGEVVEYRVGEKHLMVIPGAASGEGTREVPVPRALRTTPALSLQQATAIAAMARQLAPRLGFEADFEGAISGDALYLFQARPITTLAPRVSMESVAD